MLQSHKPFFHLLRGEKQFFRLLFSGIVFQCGVYDSRLTLSIDGLSDKEQLEHNIITAVHIDHFLMQYCNVKAGKLFNK